jgi:hypothetical protein
MRLNVTNSYSTAGTCGVIERVTCHLACRWQALVTLRQRDDCATLVQILCNVCMLAMDNATLTLPVRTM